LKEAFSVAEGIEVEEDGAGDGAVRVVEDGVSAGMVEEEMGVEGRVMVERREELGWRSSGLRGGAVFVTVDVDWRLAGGFAVAGAGEDDGAVDCGCGVR